MDTIQITENELFEIIGRGQVELFAKDKELAAYRSQIEKVRPSLVEADALKTRNNTLEASNKSLAEQNIQLDQALTEARKERDELRVMLAAREQDVAQARADAQQEVIASNKALEVERGKHDQSPARSRGKSSHA